MHQAIGSGDPESLVREPVPCRGGSDRGSGSAAQHAAARHAALRPRRAA